MNRDLNYFRACIEENILLSEELIYRRGHVKLHSKESDNLHSPINIIDRNKLKGLN
jgi:hypothetical protein